MKPNLSKGRTVVYELAVQDLQDVAVEHLGRKLTLRECALVVDKLPDYIDWFEMVVFAIDHELPGESAKRIDDE